MFTPMHSKRQSTLTSESSVSGSAVILDLAAVDYISSVGLRALMLVARQIKEQGRRIAVAALQPSVAEVFKISRFNLVYQVFQGVDDALAEFGKVN
jgi:Anti-anti-sigma regulatory factor (antagonist of anti-sigma factor)